MPKTKSLLFIGLGSVMVFAAVFSFAVSSHTLTPVDIELALELAERDPLFGIEGTDPASLRASLGRLEEVTERVAETYRWQRPTSASMVSGLYPIAFLRSLADAEEARQQFLQERSSRTFYEYERHILKVIKQFQIDLAASERIARFIAAQNTDSYSYVFFGGSVTKDDVFRKLEELKEGVQESESLFKNRSRCVRGMESACDSIYRVSGLLNRPTLTALVLPEQIRANRALLEDSVVPELNLELAERYPIVEVEHALRCLSPLGNPLYLLPFRREGSMGGDSLYLHPLNELFFWDAEEAARESGIPYFRAMHELGLRYSYQPTAFYYLCPDNIEIAAQVNTLLAIRENIRNAPLPISSFDIGPDAREEIVSVLHSITEGPVLRQREVEWLLSVLDQANREYPPHEAKLRARLASLLSMYRERSPNLDWIIEMAISQNYSYLRGREAGYFSLLDTSYIYLSRAPLPFFFLAFNPSIAGIQLPMVQRPGAPVPHLVGYSSEVRDVFEREMVVEIFMKQAARFELGLLSGNHYEDTH